VEAEFKAKVEARLGERLDVGWAIDVLHPLAAGPSPGCR
jgi:hypothetical protein